MKPLNECMVNKQRKIYLTRYAPFSTLKTRGTEKMSPWTFSEVDNRILLSSARFTIYKYFLLPSVSLLFHFLDTILYSTKVKLIKSNLMLFFLLVFMLSVADLRGLY